MEFVKVCAASLPLAEPVYEFGSRWVRGGGAADMRPFFPGKKFVGTDLRVGRGVDIILDLHQIDLPTDSVGTALLLDTLEHVEYPRRAMDELHRVLKPEGLLILTTVFRFQIHSRPDYWRFTPKGLLSLLTPFEAVDVYALGDVTDPHTVAAVAGKTDSFNRAALARDLTAWKERWHGWHA